MLPAVGSHAPSFSLFDQSGKMHKLKDYAGSWVLVYFYPEDDTPGCTKEACRFRDSWNEIRRLRCTVLGISPDDTQKHAAFAKKYELPFALLSDPDHRISESYGTWVEKQFLGKRFMGIARTSFLIDAQGMIAKVYEHVKPETHADDVLTDLRERTVLT